MLVIGIVGGIASGKSFVAEQLCRLGAVRIDADLLGHQVLMEEEVREQLRERWGESVFDASGAVDRAAVSRWVFAPPPDGPRDLAWLEQLTHPRIGERMRRQIAELAEQGTVKAVILDAAVMLKAGWADFCDLILFVEAPRLVRLERALQRGWSAAEFAAREAAQEKLDEKRSRAHRVIDNSGSPDHTLAQVRHFWQTLD